MADYIIDMGKDGGRNGGEVLCTGTPEQICKNKQSYTTPFLVKELT
jgi:excinuclease ABC subunit A